MLLLCISDACLSIGSLKYMHHFGLDSFAIPEEHWSLQASLTHSISDELLVLSFASVLDASALASWDLRGTGFVGGKIGSIGTASLIGFSRSKIPALRASSESKSKKHSEQPIHFCSRSCRVRHIFCRIMLATQAVKETDLRGRLLIC